MGTEYYGLKVGDEVRLKVNPKAGTAKIDIFYSDITGGARLDKQLGGFHSWNAFDLEKVTLKHKLEDAGVGSPQLDQIVHDGMSAAATRINNEGIEAQADYLESLGVTVEEILEQLEQELS